MKIESPWCEVGKKSNKGMKRKSNSKINSFKVIFKQLYLHLDLLISSSYIVGGSVCYCNYCDDPKQKIYDKLFFGDL